jgi:hypothetical protein
MKRGTHISIFITCVISTKATALCWPVIVSDFYVFLFYHPFNNILNVYKKHLDITMMVFLLLFYYDYMYYGHDDDNFVYIISKR